MTRRLHVICVIRSYPCLRIFFVGPRIISQACVEQDEMWHKNDGMCKVRFVNLSIRLNVTDRSLVSAESLRQRLTYALHRVPYIQAPYYLFFLLSAFLSILTTFNRLTRWI